MNAAKVKSQKEPDYVVIETGRTSFKDLYTKEDWMAIWMGFFLLIVGMLIFLPNPPVNMNENLTQYNSVLKKEAAKAPFKTIEWYNASSAKRAIRGTDQAFAKTIANFLAAPSDWKNNPLDALVLSQEAADKKSASAKEAFDKAKAGEEAALATATVSQAAAAAALYKDTALNEAADTEIKTWQTAKGKTSKAKSKASIKPFNRFPYLIGLCLIMGAFFGIGKAIMGKSFGKFFIGFIFVFFLAVLAYLAETQALMKHWGFGYPLWAIVFGLLISNTIGTPKWVEPAVATEFFIKTGLVLLGAEILFGKILAIGKPGIFLAWICTPITLILTYWVGQKIIKMPSKTLNITISADMSVCGVSAAIATAAACRAKKEELTLAIGLSMVFTAICMVAQPAFAKLVGMPEILAGAWMGATIDSTGAVAAAGAFYGEKALYVAATIKMIQNILIGVVAFCVAVYWCARVDCKEGTHVSWWEIWYRFPKFVVGFIIASIVFSIVDQTIGKDMSAILIDHGVLRGFTRIAREWFFVLAFTCIGLETNFKEFGPYFKGGKPITLYVFGQGFQLILTLIVAYIMFYIVFPEVTAGI
ncbi:MAG: YeiH family protein [Proteobacteria bacterium]|nr:putative sulfate exporter family transporter [Desulfobacula sp.]MBU3951869.1 YeiH family protein [Pseudomonadota bacterium]MBU4132666.1 YeiH family protein [Pseudomonadota bacterium]